MVFIPKDLVLTTPVTATVPAMLTLVGQPPVYEPVNVPTLGVVARS